MDEFTIKEGEESSKRFSSSPTRMSDILGNTALHWVAKWGSVTQIQLIVNRPMCVDVVNKVGETALHVAAREGKRPAVITLCELNANVNATDFIALTPVHLAAGTGKYFVLKELESRGATSTLETSIIVPFSTGPLEVKGLREQ